MPFRIMDPALHTTRLAAVIILCLVSCGCGLAYKNRLSRDGFIVYTNDGQGFLEKTGDQIETIYDSLAEVFEIPKPFPWTTRIFLDGQAEGVLDYSYNPDLLGYYVPFLQMIRIDSRAAASNLVSDLDQVLLHEIAHHFLVNELPGISGKCWLNEGLAGNIEVGVIEKDRAEFPLLNPVLLKIAQREITENENRPLLTDLLQSDWTDFHNEETREMNYALSWSIVYHLLTREFPAALSLKDRINRIHFMDKTEISALESGWRKNILGLDLVAELSRLARLAVPEKKMTSAWAIKELCKVRGADVRRSLETLVKLFEAPCPQTREEAYISFLRLLSSNPQAPFLEPEQTAKALTRLQAIIADSEASPLLRARLVANLKRHRTLRNDWIPLLVDTLEDSRPIVRAAAASALSKMASKPTIVSPAFWTSAPTSKRNEEVSEWKRWLVDRARR